MQDFKAGIYQINLWLCCEKYKRKDGKSVYNPQLETFLCVAESGSFNKAAEKLYISPPAVIKQINLLEENLDLQYRREQLQRLQKEVVDLEDLDTGINIMDLGLNEFRMDLVEYNKKNPDLDHTPFGLEAVVYSNGNAPQGVVFVLKNRNSEIDINSKNVLHPFYLVYVSSDKTIVYDHLSAKKILDTMRGLCKNKSVPDKELCNIIRKETNDGENMSKYSDMLQSAIQSIIAVNDKSDTDSFLDGDNGNLFANEIKGLDDFELICFLIVR